MAHTSISINLKLQLQKSFLFSPQAERVAVSEGTGNKKSALFLQGPDDIFVSVLLKKMKNLVI
jgi:hypothetical protein